MLQKLVGVLILCMAEVDAKQFLGRGGNVAPMDLTNNDFLKNSGHGVQVNHEHSFGD